MNRKIPYFVKLDFNYESKDDLILLEQKIEKSYWIELGKRCFLEKYQQDSFYYFGFGSESHNTKSYNYCNKLDRIFG